MRAAGTTSTWNAGVVPIDERLRQVQRRVGPLSARFRGATTSTDTGRLGVSDEVEHVVRRQRVGAGADGAADVRPPPA